jgi:YegS/Rv2252/BmrU family lipid kinase
MDLVEQADLKKYDGLAAAGGDGTLFEVINGYYRNPAKKKPPLGLIPNGTGNAFARDLDLRTFEWKKAVDIISGGKTRKVDAARFRTEGKDYYYLNILGLGFVADVGSTAKHLKVFGNNAYIMGVFHRLAALNTFNLSIELDNQKLQRECIFVEVSNTTFTGSTFLMAPNAKIDDGLLDVVILNKINRRRLLKLFPTIFKGTHIHEKEVEYIQAKKIKIETDIPKILTPDGELMGSSPVEIECLHKAVEVFWG